MENNKQKLIHQMGLVDKYNINLYYWILADIINTHNYKNGIEIGVLFGGHIDYLIKNTNVEFILGIDPFLEYGVPQSGCSTQEDFDGMYLLAMARLTKTFRSTILRSRSDQAYHYIQEIFPGQYFDFVFIDGSHEYPDAKSDIELYKNLIKKGGCLCGHDYNNFEGVTRAVNEFIDKTNLPLYKLAGSVWATYL